MSKVRTAAIGLALLVTGVFVLQVVGAAGHPNFPAVSSQLAWMQQNGAKFDQWVKGKVVFWGNASTEPTRGYHPNDTAQCVMCHKEGALATTGTVPVYPQDSQPAGSCGGRVCHTDRIVNFNSANYTAPVKNGNKSDYGCGTACHGWLKTTKQAGFPNAVGANSTYEGSISPLALLNYTKDVNGNGRSHKTIYETYGCRSFCHDSSMTLAKAQAWAANGTDPAIPKGVVHGEIPTCTTCHEFNSPLGGSTDLHTTHIPFIQAEKATGDTRGTSGVLASCEYCHGTMVKNPLAPPTQTQTGGCYNCHLSGHRPETYYWAATPDSTSV